jgi:lysophospholipase L1-like esterase
MENNDRLPLKTKILLIFLPSLIIIGILIMAEAYVRYKMPHISKLQLFTGKTLEDKVEVTYGEQIFEGDAALGWKLKSNLNNVFWDFTTFSTNKQGLRYPDNIKPKEKNSIRIIALGDSVTFGYRVPVAFPENPLDYNRDELPYTAIMEKSLNQKLGKKAQVIPLAVPGYTSYQGLKLLEKNIDDLKPDLVIALFGWNDTELHVKADKQILPSNGFKASFRNIAAASQAIIYAANSWFEKPEENTENNFHTEPRVSKQDYIQNLIEIKNLADKYGAKTLVIGPIYMDSESNGAAGVRIAEYRTALAKEMQNKKISYLEIEKLTEKGYPDNKILFEEPVHPNSLGHKLMAEKILNAINDHKLVP